MIILKKICYAIFFIKPQTNVLELFFKKHCCHYKNQHIIHYTVLYSRVQRQPCLPWWRIAIAMSYTSYRDRFYDTTGTPGYSCADSMKSIFSTPAAQEQLFCPYPAYSQKFKYTNITKVIYNCLDIINTFYV